ncbi:protein of unknown function [Micropruina glycogenica]|uniref:Uncharacterized protein n=1 Tax=Micropruina glycogenica TaxID=75385 RepID=A0A2N9JCZ1_9ACTN|nr:protein of unknown function [Micropruina glycogenica]
MGPSHAPRPRAGLEVAEGARLEMWMGLAAEGACARGWFSRVEPPPTPVRLTASCQQRVS